MIIAIDGVAGSGKSSTAKKVAYELGFNYFSTGKMYRAITYYCIKNNLVNQLPESIDCYRRALLIDRDNQSVKLDLCFALKKAGKLKEAASIFKNLKYKDSRAFYIECLLALNSKEEFYKELNDACKNFKGNRNAG